MELTTEELDQVEELAAVFLPIEEIALLLCKEVKLFKKLINKAGTDLNKAYQRGKITSKVTILQSVVKMAQMGSPQAQKDVLAFMTKQDKSERERY